jgi:hypothetical protein
MNSERMEKRKALVGIQAKTAPIHSSGTKKLLKYASRAEAMLQELMSLLIRSPQNSRRFKNQYCPE